MATTNPRRVLVLTLSFGTGHVRAARAIAAEIARDAPEAVVQVVDALAGCRWLFRAGYVWPYWAMVRYAPALWGRLFAARLRGRHSGTAPAWAFRFGCPGVFATIERFRPDLIVAVEVAACEMAVIARRARLTTAAVVNVITDRHAEPAWVKPEAELYAVADSGVAAQIRTWGADAARIAVCGIPIDSAFEVRTDSRATRARYGLADDRPLVLLMGGGMGPTHMDAIAARLCASGRPMHVVAVTGHDTRARRRVARVRAVEPVSLSVLGWTDDVPALMHAAAILVTKPGGLTTAEAAACGVPTVLCDAIPGPEQQNASAVVGAGAGFMALGAAEAAAAVLSLLGDACLREAMAAASLALARPAAARSIAALALATNQKAAPGRTTPALEPTVRPVLILTISNGAGHTRVAEAIAGAVKANDDEASVVVLDVAQYMTRLVRATHVTVYLWLVRHVPAVWKQIDRFQKRQPRTSPAWYYRRGCRRLFDAVGELRPRALLATEVGCCEIAALLKRDLSLDCPLVAVNGEYDADRAWVQPEVDLYCTPTTDVLEELCRYGAPRFRIRAWGVPLAPEFTRARGNRDDVRRNECRRLGLSPDLPLILVAGGSEGLGRVEAIARCLLSLPGCHPQVVVIAGRNERLKARCERLALGEPAGRLRVLGWTSRMAELMRAADLLVSKPGHTFDEALASRLPLVALEPPPGSEQVQYRLLDEWGTGRAVRTLDELSTVVRRLLAIPAELDGMRKAASARRIGDAASCIADWLAEQRTSGRRGQLVS